MGSIYKTGYCVCLIDKLECFGTGYDIKFKKGNTYKYILYSNIVFDIYIGDLSHTLNFESFKKYFMDIQQHRENKINQILNE